MDEVWLHAAVLSARALDDDAARAAIDALPGTAPPADAVFEQLWKAKVVREADRRMSAWATVPTALASVRDHLRTVVAEDDAWRADAVGPMTAAVAHAAEAGVTVMKGLALAALYEEPLSRHLGDVDLHCAGWENALEVCRRLVSDGWVWDTTEPPWLKWDGHEPYGQLSLVTPDNADPVARVDLHVGPYSVGPNGRVAVPDAVPGTVLGVPVRVAGPDALAVILVAHAVNDGFSSMKDHDDLAVLLRGGAALATVRLACAAFGGTPVLDQLLATGQSLDAVAAAPRSITALDALAHQSAHGPLALRPPRGRVRAARAGRFAYRVGRIDGQSRSLAARTAWRSYQYYAADLSPRPGRPRATLEPRSRRPDVCWRLLPAEAWPAPRAPAGALGAISREQLAAGVVRHVSGHGVAVTLDTQVFVPTVWGRIAAESVALATSLAAGDGPASAGGSARD